MLVFNNVIQVHGGATMSKRMNQLEEQLKQVQERIKNQVERERTKERNEDNRRKFLIGQCILEKHRTNGHPERLAELMDGFLKNTRDRVLFGLPAKEIENK